jgi:hypothetical protein
MSERMTSELIVDGFEMRQSRLCGVCPNTAIGMMRRAGETNIAAPCRRFARRFAAQPWSALALIGIKHEN